MIHTVHLFYKLDYQFYTALFQTLQELSRIKSCKFYREKDLSYHCHYLLKETGLKLILRHLDFEGGISYHALEIIMNPIRLLNNDEYLCLTEYQDYFLVEMAFRTAWNPIKKKFESKKKNKYHRFNLDDLNNYSVKRFDYAINFRTEHIKLYMKLIKRSNIPNGFELYQTYSSTNKRWEQPLHGFYIFKKGGADGKRQVSLSIQCYDKGEQLRENNLPTNEETDQTLRFEVQFHYNKVNRLQKSYRLDSKGICQYLSEGIYVKEINRYFKKTVGYGDYYSLFKAKELIQSRSIRSYTKMELNEVLNMVNMKRGIWKARREVEDKKEFDMKIKKLHELGINPVTIPVSEGIDYLPCLFNRN